MEISMRNGLVILAAAGLIAVGGPALAAHGKAGLWQITTKMDIAGMPMMSPQQMDKMRAMGMHMPMGTSITTQHCMTAQEVATDVPPAMDRAGRKKECRMANLKTSGQSVSADLVCDGKDVGGGGHFALVYDSPEHYAGTMKMTTDIHGHHTVSNASFEAKWISASCGSVTH